MLKNICTRFEAAASRFVPALEALQANDTSEAVRMWAGCALLRLQPERTELLRHPLRHLGGGDGPLKRSAIEAMGYLSRSASEAVAVLVEESLRNADPQTRHEAVRSIKAIGFRKEQIDPFIKALSTGEPDLQRRAAKAMADLGYDSVLASALLSGMRADDAEVRRMCVLAFGNGGPVHALHHRDVEALLVDTHSVVRRSARYALCKMRHGKARCP